MVAIATQLAQILIPIMHHHCFRSTDPSFKDDHLAKPLASFVDSGAVPVEKVALFFLYLVLFTVGGGSQGAVTSDRFRCPLWI